MRDDVVAALRPGGLRRRRRAGAAGAGVELGPDQRGGTAQAGRRRDRPAAAGAAEAAAREPDPDHAAPVCADVARARGADRPTPRRRRGSARRRASRCTAAGRAPSRSSTSRRCDGHDVAQHVPSARRRRRRPSCATTPWRSRSTCPAELADEFAFRPGQSRHGAPHGRRRRAAPLVLDLRAGRRAAADRRARGSRRGGVDRGWSATFGRATASRCSVRAARSRPTSTGRPTTC